jgi:hypothetical protein
MYMGGEIISVCVDGWNSQQAKQIIIKASNELGMILKSNPCPIVCNCPTS